jgi:hypothetical protein
VRTHLDLFAVWLCAGVLACAGGAYAATPADKIHFKDKVDKETTSQLQVSIAAVNVAGLPTSGRKPAPTLAGQTVTFSINGTSFQGTADSKGKIALPFNAMLKGTQFTLKSKGMPLIALFPLVTTDGKDKTVGVHFKVTAEKAGQAKVVLVDKTVVLIYSARNGSLTGKGPASALDTTSPSVIATNPANSATGVPLNQKVSATFSEEMDSSSISAISMTLAQGTTPVSGTVSYADSIATFIPSSDLSPNTTYSAMITTQARDLAGNELLSGFTWTFATGGSTDSTSPAVTSTIPLNGANGVAINNAVTSTFSKAMNSSTLTTATFTVQQGTTPVSGSVSYFGTTATFKPTASLASNTLFTATITTGATDLAGNALAANYTWSFTTGASAAKGPAPVSLGAAGNFVILAKSAIDTVPTSAVTGDIGLSPAAASFITGFGLTADSSNVFSTSPQITGKAFAADYAVPTPSNLTTAVSNMESAYTDAAGRPTPDFSELGAGDISGLTLVPGLYKWGTGVSINTDVTLDGGPNDVWIFQIGQGITQANGAKIILTSGALPKNIFWQSSGVVSIGTTAHFEGVILSQTSITLDTGASINGRLLAQTAVTIKSSTVSQPAQ